ncbi:MAG: DUF6318 family protein [Nocardioides sp.]|uniref:DUF6318 family protein n=1 Tax=Nocardioides sp. TaxID=35761 RepID=UPI0039E655D5
MGTPRRSGIISRFCAAGLALDLLVLAGCSDDAPGPPPPTSSSPTSSTPTEPTDSPSPQPESAEDFIRRWVEVNREMQNTGETEAFMSLAGPTCHPCRSLSAAITKFYSAGGYVKTKGWKVHNVRKASTPSTRSTVVIVDVESRPTEYQETQTGPVKTLPGERTKYQFTLRGQHGSWLVEDYMEIN